MEENWEEIQLSQEAVSSKDDHSKRKKISRKTLFLTKLASFLDNPIFMEVVVVLLAVIGSVIAAELGLGVAKMHHGPQSHF